MKINAPIALVLSLLAVSCTEDQPAPSSEAVGSLAQAMETPEYAEACSETPGCSATPDSVPGPAEPVWRVRVVREPDGAVRIEDVEGIRVVAGNGVPIGALYSELALVGRDADGTVVDGQGIRFPTTLKVEYEDGTAVQQVDLAGQEVDTVAYVRALPEIVSLAVEDAEGRTVHSVDVPATPANASLLTPMGLLGIGDAHAATRPFQNLPPWCAHVIVLQGEFQRHLAGGMEWENSITLVQPGSYQLAATRAALERMTPLLCQGFTRIAFGHVPESVVPGSVTGAVASASAGDMIVINVAGLVHEVNLQKMISRRLMLQKTVTHEAGHAAETLLNFESSNPGNYQGAWAFPARTLAGETIDNVRLEIGLVEEWQRLHQSFIQQGWAKPHGSYPLAKEGDPPVPWRPDDVVDGGFMSQYSSSNWAEDIADFVGWAYLSRAYTDSFAEHGVSDELREDFGCLIMREYGEKNLPADYAAVYTKLHFLQDLGLVRPEDVRDCTGEALGLHTGDEGFHIWQDGQLRRSFTDGLEAGLGTTPVGARLFTLSAAGEAGFGDGTYPAELRLQLGLGTIFKEFDKVSWPRGVYKLGLKGNNNFTLRLDGAPAGNFDAMDGYALVAESSSKRIAGSVVLQRVFRLQAPLPVPEKYDPPLVVRFLIEK